MFADKKKNTAENSKLPNYIGVSTKIKGEINSQEDFRIDGHFEGNLTTTGKIVLGVKGVLDGNIKCDNAEVLGKISGDLVVENLLSLKSTAKVEGNVVIGKLAIEAGAGFNATCQMKNAQTVKNVAAKTK